MPAREILLDAGRDSRTDLARRPVREGTLSLAILIGKESPTTCRWISTLAELPGVRIAGILLEAPPASLWIRLWNLGRTIRRQGIAHLFHRIGGRLNAALDRLARRLINPGDVLTLLQQSFPGGPYTLKHVGERYGIPVFTVGDVNGSSAVDALRQLQPDLGVVLGTQPLKRSTFSVPRMGSISLCLGKMPAYRGVPPGFWELYDGQPRAGVTVLLVDDGVGTDDILGEDIVVIDRHDSPGTLRRKLEIRGGELLARCVGDLAHGRVAPRSQPGRRPPRTLPTRRQERDLHERLGLAATRRPSWREAGKSLLYLLLYYGGLFWLVRATRHLAGGGRACVLVYHRVNDFAEDPLTTDVRRFAEHMLLLRKYYSVVPTSVLVDRIKANERLPRRSIAIHFDDCYRDVQTYAAPVLSQLGFPACCFVCSGYVGTGRQFAHDAEKYPWTFENLRPEDLVALTRNGFEVGSHTVNHIDLGQCPADVAQQEVEQCRRDLEAIVGTPVTLFSYPFGKATNIRAEVVELIGRCGYEAIFSAYGGYITDRSNVSDLPRVAISGTFRPLDLLMEIEGLSLSALQSRWARAFARFR